MQPANLSTSKKSRFQLLASILILVLAGWIFLNRQYVLDEVALYRYSPPAEITTLATNATMTDRAQRYFYASHPEINSADDFNRNCKAEAEQTIILGCYTMRRIYLFDVSDERLNGVKEVTAAHEMLHAAYDRLGAKEKSDVNRMVTEQTAKIDDERILGLIDLYNKSEPGQLANEMHSILATEVVNLSPELESYYGRYFTDRQQIVRYSQQYEGIFSSLNQRRQEISAELEQLNQTVNQRSEQLNSAIAQLNADIATFNQQARSGEFSSQQEFQARRQQLLRQQGVLTAERNEINALIARFDQLKAELSTLNGQAQSLNQSLDSTPEQVPTLEN